MRVRPALLLSDCEVLYSALQIITGDEGVDSVGAWGGGMVTYGCIPRIEDEVVLRVCVKREYEAVYRECACAK